MYVQSHVSRKRLVIKRHKFDEPTMLLLWPRQGFAWRDSGSGSLRHAGFPRSLLRLRTERASSAVACDTLAADPGAFLRVTLQNIGKAVEEASANIP